MRHRVRLVIAADSPDARALGLVARELMVRLDVTVRIIRTERIDLTEIAGRPLVGGGFVAEGWIDLRQPGRATLFLLDPASDRLLIREIDRPKGGEELASEQLAHILETSVEGLLAGAQIGIPRTEALLLRQSPPDAQPEPPRPAGHSRAPRRTRVSLWQLGLGYEVGLLSTEIPVTHGPFASILGRVPTGQWRPGLWMTAQYRLPAHAWTPPVGARIEGGAWRWLLTLEGQLTETVVGRAGLGAGVDLVALRPETTQPSRIRLAESTWQELLVLRACLGADVRLSAWAWFQATLALDWDTSGTRYVFATGDGDQTVLEPRGLRPAALMGIAVP